MIVAAAPARDDVDGDAGLFEVDRAAPRLRHRPTSSGASACASAANGRLSGRGNDHAPARRRAGAEPGAQEGALAGAGGADQRLQVRPAELLPHRLDFELAADEERRIALRERGEAGIRVLATRRRRCAASPRPGRATARRRSGSAARASAPRPSAAPGPTACRPAAAGRRESSATAPRGLPGCALPPGAISSASTTPAENTSARASTASPRPAPAPCTRRCPPPSGPAIPKPPARCRSP